MELEALTLWEVATPFRTEFRHSSARRARTEGIWVEARTRLGSLGVGESCPRSYVTGESVESSVAFFCRHRAHWQTAVHEQGDLLAFAREQADDVDAHPAAWCAVELALLDALARDEGVSVETLLGLAAVDGEFTYSAVVGGGSEEAVRAVVAHYLRLGMHDFKVKLRGRAEADARSLETVAPAADRLRADGNNCWDDAAAAVEAIRRLPVSLFAIEEPLGAGDFTGMQRVFEETGIPVILDESATGGRFLESVARRPECWIVNVRLSKQGGLQRSRDLVRQVTDLGIRVVVGSHVGETSLLTRAALPVARSAGEMLVAQEGAFGTMLLQQDVIDPALMFGAGGVLEVTPEAARRAGFGIDPSSGRGILRPREVLQG